MKLRFLGKTHHHDDISTFRFQPPEPTGWIAGQSIRISLPAGWGNDERRFTIVSPPHSGEIDITTRVSQSKFKQALDDLEPGREVDAFAIEGKFVWRDTDRPQVMVAGGIGITPYMSILRQRHHDGEALSCSLIYAAKTDQLLFVDELRRLTADHPEFKLTLLEGRRPNVELMTEQANGSSDALYYLSGPSGLVDDLATDLLAAGVPTEQILKDLFTGWDEPA